MGTTLRLKLRPGFREPLNSGTGFVGRTAEVARLSAILRHRPAATVLVSGHRGVGKTALVEEALRQCADSKTIVARLSLPHIHAGDTDASRELRGQILRSLARSLHFAMKDRKGIKSELKRRALALYNKSYLKDLQEQGQLKDLTQAEVQHRQTSRNETRIDPGKVVGVILGSVGAAAIAAGGIAITSVVERDHGLGWALLSFLVVMVAAVAAGITVTRVCEEEKNVTTQVLEERSATQTGSFDLSPETLEYELQELLRSIKASQISTVFVIDELDKLETGPQTERLEEHVIFAILASLKNFFTLGSGIYIFISGEDFYARMEASIENNSYSLAHTLFTDRTFVHVLPYGDIEKLIDGLLAESPEDRETYRKVSQLRLLGVLQPCIRSLDSHRRLRRRVRGRHPDPRSARVGGG